MSANLPENPFMPSAAVAESDAASGLAGNDQTRLLLKQTRPWVSAMGILTIVFGVLGTLGGIGMIVFGLFAGQGGGPREMGMFAGVAVVYVLFGILYLVPGFYLISYSRRIRDYMIQPSHDNLNAALKAQKSFWKFVGMLILVMFVMYVLMFLGMIIFGAASQVPS